TSPRKRTWLAAGFTMDGASGPHKTPKSTRVSPVRNIMTTSPVGRLLNSSPLKPDQTNRPRQHGSAPRRLSHKKLARPSLYGVRPEDVSTALLHFSHVFSTTDSMQMPLLYSLRKKVDGSLANDYAGNFEAALKLRISRVVETMVYNGTPRYPEHIIQAELERIDMEEARKAMAEDGKDLFENQVAEAVNANRLTEEPTQHRQKNAACL
ncbi:hypothetical protein KEM55_006130, partial [Ascosphaera atra]